MTHADLFALGYALKGKEGQKVATTESAVNVKDDGTVEMFVKHDDGKARFDLLQPLALTEVAKVLAHGAAKYTPNNWRKGAAWSRYYGAMQRHLNAWWAGERKDKDSGLDHLAHAACCLMFLQSYEIEGLGTDDRPCCAPDDTQRRMPTTPVVPETFDPAMKPGTRPLEEIRKEIRARVRARKSEPSIERIPNEEGHTATTHNSRLFPSDVSSLLFNGYRYQNPAGRVVYIVTVRRVWSSSVALGSAVLQPGDTEDRKIGLQIAVGQALKNFNRERFYGRSPYVTILACDTANALDVVMNAYKSVLPPIAELEIERADKRKERISNRFWERLCKSMDYSL